MWIWIPASEAVCLINSPLLKTSDDLSNNNNVILCRTMNDVEASHQRAIYIVTMSNNEKVDVDP